MRYLLLTLIVLPLAGCAKYQFDLVNPQDLARKIGDTEATAVTVSCPPLEYSLQSVEGRLLMRITNPTDRPIELLGPQTSVVDPDGQSHPMPTRMIAPHNSISVSFPPLRPYTQPAPIGGSGVGVGSNWVRDYPWYAQMYRGEEIYGDVHTSLPPIYLSNVGDSDEFYWSWTGHKPVTMRFAYRMDEQNFTQEFVVSRKKVK